MNTDLFVQTLNLIAALLDHPPPWFLYTLYVTSGFMFLRFLVNMVPVTSIALWKLTKFGRRTKETFIEKTAALLHSMSDRLKNSVRRRRKNSKS